MAGFGLGQFLRLAANVVLAAILFEEVFALMAIVLAVMMGLAGLFNDGRPLSMVVGMTAGPLIALALIMAALGIDAWLRPPLMPSLVFWCLAAAGSVIGGLRLYKAMWVYHGYEESQS